MEELLIVDDHPLIREGLAQTIDRAMGLTVSWEAEGGEEALAIVESEQPDLAIVDISMPGMGGIELIKQLQSRTPELKILVISRHDEEFYARRVLRAGALGYLRKGKASEHVIEAIREILDGGIYVSPPVRQAFLEDLGPGRPTPTGDHPVSRLSDREMQVFEGMANCLSTKEIAQQMSIAVKTVQTYRSRIKEKLNVESTPELLHQAFQWLEGDE